GGFMPKVPTQNKRGTYQALLFWIFLSLFFNSLSLGTAQAVPGILDTSFGLQGMVTTDFSGTRNFDDALAVAIQSDGKILVAGKSDAFGSGDLDFTLARYNTDGTLDTSFNPSGSVPGVTSVDVTGAGNEDQATALAIQSDQQIVVAGFAFVNSS